MRAAGARCRRLDWRHLLGRFGDEHWRVLFSHLVLFGFVYPSERAKVPGWVLEELTGRLLAEARAGAAPADGKLCRGTLLSRAQYLIDVDEWGYEDARLAPRGPMTGEEIVHWTAAINEGK